MISKHSDIYNKQHLCTSRRNAHVQSKTNDIKPNKRRYEHEMTLYWVLYVVFGDRSLLLGVSSTFSALLDITKLTRQMTDGRVLLQLLRHSREESKSQHVAYHHIKFHLNGKKLPILFHSHSLTHSLLPSQLVPYSTQCISTHLYFGFHSSSIHKTREKKEDS